MAGFVRAQSVLSLLRMAFVGPPGSGKTYSALSVATALRDMIAPGKRIGLVDTEHASAAKYARYFDFDTLILKNFSPTDYVNAMNESAKAGHFALIIDSLSHAWAGKGGVLEFVDEVARRSRSQNTFTAWREATPEHNKLVEAMLSYPGHLLVTMRTKVEWVLEKDERTGKQAPRKVGLQPVQREGLEYEFDVVGELDEMNRYSISKTRYRELNRKTFDKPGKEIADLIGPLLMAGGPATGPSVNVEPPLPSNIVTSAVAAVVVPSVPTEPVDDGGWTGAERVLLDAGAALLNGAPDMKALYAAAEEVKKLEGVTPRVKQELRDLFQARAMGFREGARS